MADLSTPKADRACKKPIHRGNGDDNSCIFTDIEAQQARQILAESGYPNPSEEDVYQVLRHVFAQTMGIKKADTQQGHEGYYEEGAAVAVPNSPHSKRVSEDDGDSNSCTRSRSRRGAGWSDRWTNSTRSCSSRYSMDRKSDSRHHGNSSISSRSSSCYSGASGSSRTDDVERRTGSSRDTPQKGRHARQLLHDQRGDFSHHRNAQKPHRGQPEGSRTFYAFTTPVHRFARNVEHAYLTPQQRQRNSKRVYFAQEGKRLLYNPQKHTSTVAAAAMVKKSNRNNKPSMMPTRATRAGGCPTSVQLGWDSSLYAPPPRGHGPHFPASRSPPKRVGLREDSWRQEMSAHRAAHRLVAVRQGRRIVNVGAEHNGRCGDGDAVRGHAKDENDHGTEGDGDDNKSNNTDSHDKHTIINCRYANNNNDNHHTNKPNRCDFSQADLHGAQKEACSCGEGEFHVGEPCRVLHVPPSDRAGFGIRAGPFTPIHADDRRRANVIFDITGDARYRFRPGRVTECAEETGVRSASRIEPMTPAGKNLYNAELIHRRRGSALSVYSVGYLNPNGSTLRCHADPVTRGAHMRTVWQHDRFLTQRGRHEEMWRMRQAMSLYDTH